MDCQIPEFRGTIDDSFSSTCANIYTSIQPATKKSNEEKMLYPARWKKITVDQSAKSWKIDCSVLCAFFFFFFFWGGATRYRLASIMLAQGWFQAGKNVPCYGSFPWNANSTQRDTFRAVS